LGGGERMKRQKCAGYDGVHWVKLRDVEGSRRGIRHGALIWLLASAMAVLGTADAFSAARHKHHSAHRKKAVEVEQRKKGVEVKPRKHKLEKSSVEATTPLPPDLAAAKQAIELVRRHETKDATALAASIGDPTVAKLVEWALLRHFDSEARFDRYVGFIRANQDWPSMPLLRRRAEARLWQERREGATVRDAAIAIARLEAEARFVGPIGDDEHGTRVMDGLVEEGVATAINRTRVVNRRQSASVNRAPQRYRRNGCESEDGRRRAEDR
jgi:hypothetical protein